MDVDDPIIKSVLSVTCASRRNRVGAEARLLHDLLIMGDDFEDLLFQLSKIGPIDSSELNQATYFPQEGTLVAACVIALSGFGIERYITRQYPAYRVHYLKKLFVQNAQ